MFYWVIRNVYTGRDRYDFGCGTFAEAARFRDATIKRLEEAGWKVVTEKKKRSFTISRDGEAIKYMLKKVKA